MAHRVVLQAVAEAEEEEAVAVEEEGDGKLNFEEIFIY
jgi:hypothetical protein